MSNINFQFRIKISSEDMGEKEVEIWVHELQPYGDDRRDGTEWVQESLGQYFDPYEYFDVDKTKCWQILGKGNIVGHHDYYGEYDEDIYINEFEVVELPEAYFTGGDVSESEVFTIVGGDNE